MKGYIHEYVAWGMRSSSCRVYIKTVGKVTFVGFENREGGTSVTNASEQIATEIVKKEKLDPLKCKFFEWYPEYDGDVDEIIYTWKKGEASNPIWKPYSGSDRNPFFE